MFLTHWSCADCFLQLSRHVHDHFGVVLEIIHLLLSEHELPLVHGTHTLRQTPSLGSCPKRPLMSFTVTVSRFLLFVLSAQLVTSIPTLIFELGLVLVLDLFHPVSAVGNVLTTSFARAYPCGWVCSFVLLHVFVHPLWVRSFLPAVGPLFSPWPADSTEILVGAAVDSSLVWTCVQSSPPDVAARERRTHTTCAMWGLGHVKDLAVHVLTHVVFSLRMFTHMLCLRTCWGKSLPSPPDTVRLQSLDALVLSRARLATLSSAWSWKVFCSPSCFFWAAPDALVTKSRLLASSHSPVHLVSLVIELILLSPAAVGTSGTPWDELTNYDAFLQPTLIDSHWMLVSGVHRQPAWVSWCVACLCWHPSAILVHFWTMWCTTRVFACLDESEKWSFSLGVESPCTTAVCLIQDPTNRSLCSAPAFTVSCRIRTSCATVGSPHRRVILDGTRALDVIRNCTGENGQPTVVLIARLPEFAEYDWRVLQTDETACSTQRVGGHIGLLSPVHISLFTLITPICCRSARFPPTMRTPSIIVHPSLVLPVITRHESR